MIPSLWCSSVFPSPSESSNILITLSCPCSTVYCQAFFPNFPCLSLFFLNFPCCISFFLSFPCWGPPLFAVAFPPSSFLFMSLLGVKHNYQHISTTTNHTMFTKIPNVKAPLYADEGCVPCFLQHLVPLLIISTNPVPESEEKTLELQ